MIWTVRANINARYPKKLYPRNQQIQLKLETQLLRNATKIGRKLAKIFEVRFPIRNIRIADFYSNFRQ